MRVVTERGAYQIDEVGKGKFSVLLVESIAERTERVPCLTGRYSAHRRVAARDARPGIISALRLKVGEQFGFILGPDVQATNPEDHCCGFSNRILEILP